MHRSTVSPIRLALHKSGTVYAFSRFQAKRVGQSYVLHETGNERARWADTWRDFQKDLDFAIRYDALPPCTTGPNCRL